MLAPVHAQDAGRENLNGTRDATVERTASDPALGTVSATINVTGSSNVRGIWGKSDPLSIDTIAEEAVFNVSSTRNNAFGIDTSSGASLDIGTIAGKFNVSAANTNATGIRSYGKMINIGTMAESSVMTITANFSSNGIYAYQGGLDIGTFAGANFRHPGYRELCEGTVFLRKHHGLPGTALQGCRNRHHLGYPATSPQ